MGCCVSTICHAGTPCVPHNDIELRTRLRKYFFIFIDQPRRLSKNVYLGKPNEAFAQAEVCSRGFKLNLSAMVYYLIKLTNKKKVLRRSEGKALMDAEGGEFASGSWEG